MRTLRRVAVCSLFLMPLTLVGCFRSSSTPAPAPGPGTSEVETETSDSPEPEAAQDIACNFPDVPQIDVMTEIDGIPIARSVTDRQSTQIVGAVPVDVGNEFAAAHPGPPVTGGRLVIRFPSEPKTLNSITETAAGETYISSNIRDALAFQNPETHEYEPMLAREWITEDSIKLAPDYPGYERQVAESGGEPAGTINVEYVADATLELATFDGEGNPLGNVWVGLFAVDPENMPGAPRMGYHQWSDADGDLEVGGLVPGSYEVRVGHEIYGTTAHDGDGGLVVTPATDENPLHEWLAEGETALTLAAEEWIDLQEQTFFTYYLREDARWSDGAPYTSRDLEFAFHVINSEFVDCDSLRIYYQDLVECTPLDEHVVRMKYRQQYFKAFEFTYGLAFFGPPWHYFDDFFRGEGLELTLEELTPEQEQAQNKVSVRGETFGKFYNSDERNTYNDRPIGTGPYEVESWDKGDALTLRRRDDYWDDIRGGYLDRLVFKFIRDNTTAFQALRGGEIDFLYFMTPEQYYEDLKDNPGWFTSTYVKAIWSSPQFTYVGWNMLEEKFQDRRVRVALSLLADVDEFIEEKLHGGGVAVSGSQYYYGPGYDHSVAPIGYDPSAAADLLAEAGWIDTDGDGVLDRNGEPFEFTVLYGEGNNIASDFLAVIQRNFKQAGIQMEPRPMDFASLIDKVKNRDFDAVRMSWAQPLESDPFQIWHSSGAGADQRGSNHVSFANAEADALIEQLRLTLDEEKRACINYAFHRIIDREQPYLFMYAQKEFGAYHQRFQGVKWYALRPGFDLREWYVPRDMQR